MATKLESYNKSIITFFLGQAIQGNTQFLGYVSLQLGQFATLKLNIPLYCHTCHAIIMYVLSGVASSPSHPQKLGLHVEYLSNGLTMGDKLCATIALNKVT
jgi:hypothetical protein